MQVYEIETLDTHVDRCHAAAEILGVVSVGFEMELEARCQRTRGFRLFGFRMHRIRRFWLGDSEGEAC